ncbi:MAG: hypothetical protein VKI83_08950 [Synechococcaceae cyanobacterium]|nr:hypothetical protein [Synechococcaceae cyanobacterium]
MPTTLSATEHPPLNAAELRELHQWSPENFAYLRDRAANHGLTPEQLLAEFPSDHRGEGFVAAVLPDVQISHLIPRAFRPDLADDPSNVILELSNELGGRNQSRGDSVMRPEEVQEVQLQTDIFFDARAAELQGADPLLISHATAGSSDAAQSAFHTSHLDPEVFAAEINAAMADAGWQQGLSQMGDHVLSFLSEMGIPVATVTARGVTSLWPFLRSVDWKRFCSDWRYTVATLNRAMRKWREGGWKEATRALILGVMVAHVPHLASFAAALGLAGIGALGARWLASRRFMQGTRLGAILHRLADALMAVAEFLRRAFQLLEKVVDVVIEGASRVVKHVVSSASEGARQVLQVCTDMATTAYRATRQAISGAARAAGNLCSWVTGWFSGPSTAMA